MTEILGTSTLDDFYRSAFLRGVASTCDRRGNTCRLYVYAATPQEANVNARSNDLLLVHEDAIEVARALENE